MPVQSEEAEAEPDDGEHEERRTQDLWRRPTHLSGRGPLDHAGEERDERGRLERLHDEPAVVPIVAMCSPPQRDVPSPAVTPWSTTATTCSAEGGPIAGPSLVATRRNHADQ